MMTVDASQAFEQPAGTPSNADDMLDAVYRDLVQIHAAMAERRTDDREVKVWAQRELMGIIRDVGAFRRAHPKQIDS
jgi:hypothetical protein